MRGQRRRHLVAPGVHLDGGATPGQADRQLGQGDLQVGDGAEGAPMVLLQGGPQAAPQAHRPRQVLGGRREARRTAGGQQSLVAQVAQQLCR